MLKTLLADKPLLAAVVSFLSALAVSVCNALGVGSIGPEVTTAVDAVAGLVVSTYVGGEAHKTAAASHPAAAAPVAYTASPVATAPPAADPSAALAAALSAAAAALQTKA